MLFKDLKTNYPIFILNKQEVSLVQGRVVSVSFPRMDINQSINKTEMVVDVSIEVDGKTATYVIPESLSVTYANNLIISTDKQGLLNEVEAMKNNAEQVIASVDRQKEILEKSNALLSELNPIYKDKREADKRFSQIEDSVKEVRESISDIRSMMQGLIKEFKG